MMGTEYRMSSRQMADIESTDLVHTMADIESIDGGKTYIITKKI